MFNHSIVTVWIQLRLVGLAMLSPGLPLAIFNVTATNFTAIMPGSLQFLDHDIVYFGILKYHLVQEKLGNGIYPCSGPLGTSESPASPIMSC